MIKDWVIADYQEAVLMLKAPQELKDALKTSDRIPKFVDNIVIQIKGCEDASIALTRIQIKDIVYNMTEWFLRCLEAEGKKRYASDLEKTAIRAAEEEAKKFDKDGNADFTEEFGVKIVDG